LFQPSGFGWGLMQGQKRGETKFFFNLLRGEPESKKMMSIDELDVFFVGLLFE
jgi:hypothetical protein